MLVLTRKVGEGIAIGDEIKIIVMQVKGKQVRLGIKASPKTIVHREEVYERILEENRRAAQSSIEDITEVSKSLPASLSIDRTEDASGIRRKQLKFN